MITHHYPDLSCPIGRSVVTMGSFDGVHRGHQMILNKVVEQASALSAEAVLVTFDTHPRKVLGKEMGGNGLLTTPEERAKIFTNAGIKHLVCITFNEKIAAIEAEDFVEQVFVNRLNAVHVITGYGHRFGRGGRGDHLMLERLATIHGFTSHMIPMQQMEELMISSTRIRASLAIGRVDEAARYLGYTYSLTGTVVHGRKLGHRIGFPTANITPSHPDKLIPAEGVYAIKAKVHGTWHKGMLNIGTRPTVNTGESTIEANLFDFNQEIYGEQITVAFVKRIRDEQKFGTVEDLQQQLYRDKETALSMLQQ
jgi:riboflavin kinase / FMN adenylyltransferase